MARHRALLRVGRVAAHGRLRPRDALAARDRDWRPRARALETRGTAIHRDLAGSPRSRRFAGRWRITVTMHSLTRALGVWVVALAMIVGACSKTVEGES